MRPEGLITPALGVDEVLRAVDVLIGQVAEAALLEAYEGLHVRPAVKEAADHLDGLDLEFLIGVAPERHHPALSGGVGARGSNRRSNSGMLIVATSHMISSSISPYS